MTFFFSDWCAKLYEHDDFNGWEQVIPETDYGTPSHNDAVTSIKVRDGCTFKAFKHIDKAELLETLTNDEAHLEHNNDEVSSFSCSCIRKFTIKMTLTPKMTLRLCSFANYLFTRHLIKHLIRH